MAAEWRPSGSRVSAELQPSGGEVSAGCRPTCLSVHVDRHATESRLTYRPSVGRHIGR